MFLTLRCRVFEDASGAYTEVPAILTPAGWLLPLLDYCLVHSHNRSVQWMVKQNHAVRLFLAYVMANHDETDPRLLFTHFAQRLYTGTFNRETGLDPSWLCWRPRSPKEVRKIIVWLTEWFEWLGAQRPSFKEINPRYAGGTYDRMLDESAYQWRREKAFLGHTWNATQPSETQGRMIRAQRPPKVERGEPPAFPEEKFLDLLQDGFRVGGRLNYRDICITLLMHGAGFRMSEPFHLFIQDVVPDPANPKQARVLIHHPSHGMAPIDWKDERGHRVRGNL